MRPDGDPERDDYGLPRVEVVIPDDARELERDLLAYRREERHRRRRERMHRVLGPITRFGLAVPLIAGALIIALVSGTLITVFGPRPTSDTARRPLPKAPQAAPGQVGGPLPPAQVILNGKITPIRDVRPGVIGIVPPACRCQPILAELARRTAERKLKFWLVADARRAKDAKAKDAALDAVRDLAAGLHLGAPGVTDDRQGVLATTYGAKTPQPKGGSLTAVLVHTDGIVGAVDGAPQPGPSLTGRLDALQRPSGVLPT